MRSIRIGQLACLLLALLLCVPAPAAACMRVPASIDELTREAEVIAVGRLELAEQQRIMLIVEEYLKGRLFAPALSLDRVIPAFCMDPSWPIPETGRALVFLERSESGAAWQVVLFGDGLLQIEDDQLIAPRQADTPPRGLYSEARQRIAGLAGPPHAPVRIQVPQAQPWSLFEVVLVAALLLAAALASWIWLRLLWRQP